MTQKLEIQTLQLPEGLAELKVSGRIDAYWAEHLGTAINEQVRAGVYRICLDLKEVDYISSASIRLFVKFYKQLRDIDGELFISAFSDQVKSVLDLAGISHLMTRQQEEKASAEIAPHQELVIGNARYFPEKYSRGEGFECRLIGDPVVAAGPEAAGTGVTTVTFPGGKLALGLGGFGKDSGDAAGRLGECAGFGDVVACQPTDGSEIPDFVIRSGDLIPEVFMKYGIILQGGFDGMVYFEPAEKGESVMISPLMKDLLEITGVSTAGLVLVAETSGLVGAAVKKSPLELSGTKAGLFDFPGVKENIFFTVEPAFERMLTAVVGVITTDPASPLMPFIRPLDKSGSVYGHFHAAVFPYHPLKKKQLPYRETIARLFGSEEVRSVMHLLNDDREAVGVGESSFVSGAVWYGVINNIDKI